MINYFPGRFMSDLKPETGFRISVKNAKEWRFYFFKILLFIFSAEFE